MNTPNQNMNTANSNYCACFSGLTVHILTPFVVEMLKPFVQV